MSQIKRVCKMKKASAEMSANRPLRATSLQVGAQAASTSVAGRATTPVKEATATCAAAGTCEPVQGGAEGVGRAYRGTRWDRHFSCGKLEIWKGGN